MVIPPDTEGRAEVIRNQAKRIENQRLEIGLLRDQLEHKERPEHKVREENQRLKSTVEHMKYLLVTGPGFTDAEIEAVMADLNAPGSLDPNRLSARDKLRVALKARQNYGRADMGASSSLLASTGSLVPGEGSTPSPSASARSPFGWFPLLAAAGVAITLVGLSLWFFPLAIAAVYLLGVRIGLGASS